METAILYGALKFIGLLLAAALLFAAFKYIYERIYQEADCRYIGDNNQPEL